MNSKDYQVYPCLKRAVEREAHIMTILDVMEDKKSEEYQDA
jgi:hypothetical protein